MSLNPHPTLLAYHSIGLLLDWGPISEQSRQTKEGDDMKGLKKKLWMKLPRPAKNVLKTARAVVKDINSRKLRAELFGGDECFVPKLVQMRDGPQDYHVFKASGLSHFETLKKSGLSPDSTVLDVGCGIGRKTLPLLHYLSQEARYDGIDTDAESVLWLKRRIEPRFPNFHFSDVSVHNGKYNAGATVSAANYRFPFDDGIYDFVIADAIFTNMLGDETRNYIHEMARVLKPGGRLLSSYFLTDSQTSTLIREGRSAVPLLHPLGVCLVAEKDHPNEAVGIDADFVFRCHSEVGLNIVERGFGTWSGRADQGNYLDVIVASKPMGVKEGNLE